MRFDASAGNAIPYRRTGSSCASLGVRSATPMRGEGGLAFGQRVTWIIRRCTDIVPRSAMREVAALARGVAEGWALPSAIPTRHTSGDSWVLCCFCCAIGLAKRRRVAAISIRCAGVVPRRVMLVVATA
jgi:hypothetical protein